VRRIDLTSVYGILISADPASVASAIFFVSLTVLISAWRWQLLLRAYGVRVHWFRLVLTVHIGQFFTLFLPGPIGDDATRMIYVSKFAAGKVGNAVTSILIDRIVGLASVFIVSALCISINWNALTRQTETKVLAGGMLIASSSFICFLIAFIFLKTNQIGYIISKFIIWLRSSHRNNSVLEIVSIVSDNRRVLTQVLSAALIMQLALCSLFYFSGRAVGIYLPFLSWLGFVPIILAANAIPVTIAGIGVRDYLMVVFIDSLGGGDQTQALAASMIVLLACVFLNLSGGLSYCFYHPSKTENC